MYALALKELKLLSRDIHGLAVLFLMPTIFILIMSLAMQNAFGGGNGPVLTVAVSAKHAGPIGARVIKQLRRNDAIEIVPANADPDFRLQLPSGFSQQLLTSPDNPKQALFSWSSDPTVLPQARVAFRNALLAAVTRVQSDELISRLERRQGADFDRLREITNPDKWHVESRVGAGAPLPSAVQQSVPGWLVFAMFLSSYRCRP